ncbi:MAG: MBL fold metallo-hydrolase [Thermoleophilaceae bacterium]
MRVHHLSCASMCPYGQRWLSGEGSLLGKAELVAHCLLIESGDGLVLVDTGFGTGDVADPKRLGQPFRALIRPRVEQHATALAQITEKGFDPADVRHLVLTHLDVDHAGGLPDFPGAQVHVLAAEKEVMENPPLRERGRYIRGHFAHGPRWATHGAGGDSWFGFESVRAIPELDGDLALVPLTGHTAGHTAVAVREGEGWLLHCGDAYFHHGEVVTPPTCPPGLRLFQNIVGHDNKARRSNQERLRELVRDHGDEVRPFCAHDPLELEQMQQPPPG